MMLVGYARISTQEQSFDLQSDALLKEGCEEIFQDVATGGHVEKRVLKMPSNTLDPMTLLLSGVSIGLDGH